MINSSLLIAKGKTVKLAIKTTAVGAVLYQWRKRGAEQLPDKALGGDTAELITESITVLLLTHGM